MNLVHYVYMQCKECTRLQYHLYFFHLTVEEHPAKVYRLPAAQGLTTRVCSPLEELMQDCLTPWIPEETQS